MDTVRIRTYTIARASYLNHSIHVTVSSLSRYDSTQASPPAGVWIHPPNTSSALFILLDRQVLARRPGPLGYLVVWPSLLLPTPYMQGEQRAMHDSVLRQRALFPDTRNQQLVACQSEKPAFRPVAGAGQSASEQVHKFHSAISAETGRT